MRLFLECWQAFLTAPVTRLEKRSDGVQSVKLAREAQALRDLKRRDDFRDKLRQPASGKAHLETRLPSGLRRFKVCAIRATGNLTVT
jgi:hypothetical protein